jgi:hypothetical protein
VRPFFAILSKRLTKHAHAAAARACHPAAAFGEVACDVEQHIISLISAQTVIDQYHAKQFFSFAHRLRSRAIFPTM